MVKGKKQKLKKQNVRRLDVKIVGIVLVAVFIIILLFAVGDYFTHLVEEEYSVPGRYFSNKLIYGTLFGFVAYLLFWKRSLWTRVLVFSVVVSVSLQVRYFLEGYHLDFVLLFLGIHFLILLVVSYFGFKMLDNYLNRNLLGRA